MRKSWLAMIIVAAVVAVFVFVPAVREPVFGVFKSTGESANKMATPPETLKGQLKVFVIRNKPHYHLRDCPALEGASTQVLTLDKAQAMYTPCPECNPPR